MKSKPVALLLADLGATKSHSRPYTNDDTPFSEAQLKTLKYRPDFPTRSGSLRHARAHCQTFFLGYNHDHRHSGIAFPTPANLHPRRAAGILELRAQTLAAAFAADPSRFLGRHSQPRRPPTAVWITPRRRQNPTQGASQATLVSTPRCLISIYTFRRDTNVAYALGIPARVPQSRARAGYFAHPAAFRLQSGNVFDRRFPNETDS